MQLHTCTNDVRLLLRCSVDEPWLGGCCMPGAGMVPSPKVAQMRTPFPAPRQRFQIYILMDRGWIKIQATALGTRAEQRKGSGFPRSSPSEPRKARFVLKARRRFCCCGIPLNGCFLIEKLANSLAPLPIPRALLHSEVLLQLRALKPALHLWSDPKTSLCYHWEQCSGFSPSILQGFPPSSALGPMGW